MGMANPTWKPDPYKGWRVASETANVTAEEIMTDTSTNGWRQTGGFSFGGVEHLRWYERGGQR